jgi:NAD(P)H-hydrate epimerase
MALGPGLGRADGAVEFARALAREAEVAMVLDADGLNAHARRPEELASRVAATVLTPHAGELARLLDLRTDDIEAERLRFVRSAAARSGAVVVLKGDDTLIADPEGIVAVSPGGSPALATAGTGDVLTGIVGAFLAKGVEPQAAAVAAIAAQQRASVEAPQRAGLVASDLIDALPRTLA